MPKDFLKRVVGLDLFRTVAIIFILISHSSIFFLDIKHPLTIDFYAFFGFYGTNIFIVLSGYLIGKEVLQKLKSESKPKKLIFDFYKKRLLRILPMYYIILLILSLIESIKSHQIYIPWKHFVFLQNFDHSSVDFFAVSWFMTLIFFFYLTIPLVFYIVTPKIKSKYASGIVIISVILISIAIRLIYVNLNDISWELDIKRNPFLRLDSFYIGILAAYLELFKSKLFKILSKPIVFFISVIVLLCIAWYFYGFIYLSTSILNTNIFFKTIGFSLISLFFSLLIPFLVVLQSKNPIMRRFLFYISYLSFTIYLIHLTIFQYTYEIIYQKNNLSILIITYFMAIILAFTGASFLTSLDKKITSKFLHLS